MRLVQRYWMHSIVDHVISKQQLSSKLDVS